MPADPRVDAYLAKLPAAQQTTLGKLRRDVARLAPDAEETISYGMPAFKVDGRFLLSYAGWKRHCSIYPIDDALLARHADVLRGYASTKGSLHFSVAQPLPDAVLADVVEHRATHASDRASGRAGY
jgi:uncharacterized protein YdhG (YjbR/CyaY superfamily)